MEKDEKRREHRVKGREGRGDKLWKGRDESMIKERKKILKERRAKRKIRSGYESNLGKGKERKKKA